MRPPIHFSETGATADQIILAEFVAPFVVIDVRKKVESVPDCLMSIEDVPICEKRYKKLPPNCCVAMLSG